MGHITAKQAKKLTKNHNDGGLDKVMMRKRILIILVALFVLSLQSCDDTTPVIGNHLKPFIVNEIEQINSGTHKGMSEYYGGHLAGYQRNGLFGKNPSLILPSRMFNIGDTIKPIDFYYYGI